MSGPFLQILGDGELVCSAQLATRLGRARSFTSRIPVAVIVCAPIVGVGTGIALAIVAGVTTSDTRRVNLGDCPLCCKRRGYRQSRKRDYQEDYDSQSFFIMPPT